MILVVGVYYACQIAKSTDISIPDINFGGNSKSKEKKRDKKNHSVYALVDLHGTAIYIGRTNNLERRKKEHKRSTNRRKLTLVPIKENLSLDEAIIREQLEIERFKTLNKLDKRANQRNEISTKSRLYDSYIEEKIDIYNNITYVGKDWDNER